MDSFQKRIVNLWYSYTFFIAPILDGLAPFVSVYLVAYAGLSPGDAGLIWFARDVSQMVFQVPLGAFVDYTTHKKAFLVLFTLVSTLVPMTIVFTTSVPILVAKSIVEGFAATSLRVFKGPFSLGIAGHENFEEVAKYTELFEHSGSLVACAIAGVIGYFLYPDVLPIFYVIGGFGSIAVIGLLLMTPRKRSCPEDANEVGSQRIRSSFMDDDMARNSTVYIKAQQEPEGCEEDEEQEEINKEAGDSTTTVSESEEFQTASLWAIFVRQRNIAYFSLAVFFFHLGNAAVLPVLGQVLALDDGKAGIPYTAANICIAQLSSFLGVYMFDVLTKKGFSINVPVSIGFGALVPRVALILVILRYSRNPYALIATQILDGLGGGVNGLSIMRVTKTCTEGTGRFGVVFSIVNVSIAIAASLSNLISGYIIDAFSYEVGFYFLLPPGFLSVFFVYLTKVVPPPHPPRAIEKREDESSNV